MERSLSQQQQQLNNYTPVEQTFYQDPNGCLFVKNPETKGYEQVYLNFANSRSIDDRYAETKDTGWAAKLKSFLSTFFNGIFKVSICAPAVLALLGTIGHGLAALGLVSSVAGFATFVGLLKVVGSPIFAIATLGLTGPAGIAAASIFLLMYVVLLYLAFRKTENPTDVIDKNISTLNELKTKAEKLNNNPFSSEEIQEAIDLEINILEGEMQKRKGKKVIELHKENINILFQAQESLIKNDEKIETIELKKLKERLSADLKVIDTLIAEIGKDKLNNLPSFFEGIDLCKKKVSEAKSLGALLNPESESIYTMIQEYKKYLLKEKGKLSNVDDE